MIYLKQLSGDYITIDTSIALRVEQIRSRLDHPYVILLGEDGELSADTLVDDGSEVSVLFQPYRLYFVWRGSKISVWPGEDGQTYCLDCSTMKRVEWDPQMITPQDNVAVDVMSFGIFSGSGCEVSLIDVLGVPTFDIDFMTLQDMLFCSCDSSEPVTLLEYLSNCPHGARDIHLYTLEKLFRSKTSSEQRLRPDQWRSRITI